MSETPRTTSSPDIVPRARVATEAMTHRAGNDRELSRVAATRRGFHDRLAAIDPDRPPSFDPRRTLRLRVEFTRQLKRRRTQVTFALLLALPVIIALAFQLGGAAGAGSPQLVSLATAGGFNFALFTEFASVGFLIIVVVTLFCGDTISSEAAGLAALPAGPARPPPGCSNRS